MGKSLSKKNFSFFLLFQDESKTSKGVRMHGVKSTLQGAAVACLSPIANNSMNNGMLISYKHVNATSLFLPRKKGEILLSENS